MSLNETSNPEQKRETEYDAPRSTRGRWTLTAAVTIIIATVLVVAGLELTVWAPHGSSGKGASVTVTDDAGRSVTVRGIPDRIVVLAPSAMDIVYRLGLRADVVGVDGGPPSAGGVYDDYSTGQVANWSLAGLPVITWEPSIDIETVLGLNPDLVIGASGTPLTGLETLQDQYGIPALYLNPPTLEGIEYDVTIVAEVTRTNATADAINAQVESSLNADAELIQNISSVPSTFLTYYPDAGGYWSFGPGSFGNDLLVQAGASSITANDTLANQDEIAGSYILAANPSVIIVGTGFGLTLQNYSAGPDWASFSAVQDNHVLTINSVYPTEPDPTMLLYLNTLILLLHPELDGGAPF